jgi:hypothetical protein
LNAVDYSETKLLIAAHESAVNALRQLTEALGIPQPGTPGEALLKQASEDCEMARLAVLADLHRQLRER